GPAPALRSVPLARIRGARGPPAQRLRPDRGQHGRGRARRVRVAVCVAAAHGVGRAPAALGARRRRAHRRHRRARRLPRRRAVRVELRRRGAALPPLHAGGHRLGFARMGGARRVRIALVHDWLTGMRGGERVLERVARGFPDADVFTLVWKRGSVSAELERHRIHTSFLDRLPGADTRYRWFLPLFPRALASLGAPGYDAVVSISHAVAKGVRARAGAPHVSIVLTPMRYVWDLEHQYFPPGRFAWPLSSYVRRTCARLRRWDRAT